MNIAHRFIQRVVRATLLVTVLGLGLPAAAQNAQQMLRKMDADGDGRISATEWLRPPRAFQLADQDADGFLTASELDAWLAAGPARRPEAPGVAAGAAAGAAGLYFIDAHGQLDGKRSADELLALMDAGGVHRSLVTAQQGLDWEGLLALTRAQPERLFPTVYTKGGGYHGGGGLPAEFLQRLAQQEGSRAFRGLGEVLVLHDGLGGRYYDVRVSLDDALVQAAFGVAQRQGWPFLLHIEFNVLSETERVGHLAQLQSFLRQHPTQPVLLMHMGLLEADALRPLLEQHANLHLLTSHTTPQHNGLRERGNAKPKIALFEGPRLAPRWRALMEAYPERFVFALDNVNSDWWQDKPYLAQMHLWWAALRELPPAVAHAVAHGNAERLWRLPPGPAGGMTPPGPPSRP